jgi:hypothetical protein
VLNSEKSSDGSAAPVLCEISELEMLDCVDPVGNTCELEDSA